MDQNFFGERVKPNVIKRKAGSERPSEEIRAKEGMMASEILKKLKKEAEQQKAAKNTEINAEMARLNNIFEKKADLH